MGLGLAGCFVKGSITELESEFNQEKSDRTVTTTTTLATSPTTTTTTTTLPADFSSGPNVTSATIANHSMTIVSTHTPVFQISGFTANLDPISKYQLALGTSSGATDILNWTDIGSDSLLSRSGLTLTENQNVYPQIRAVDTMGRSSSAVNGETFKYKKPLPAPNGQVSTLKKYGDKLYVGGDFSYVGTPTGGGNVVSVDSGTNKVSFVTSNPNIAVNGKVYAVASVGTGVVIGGSFTKIAGLSGFSNLAFIRSDGSVANWKPQVNGTVKALFYQSGNTRLFVGGSFTSVDSNARTNLAVYTLTTSGTPENVTASIGSWSPNPNGEVRAINENVTLAFGGAFTNFDGAARNYFALVNKSTLAVAVSDFLPNAAVNTIERNNLNFYVGGEFTTVNGSSRGYAARYSDSGNALAAWDPVANGFVRKIYCYSSTCMIAGDFSTVLSTNVARPGLAMVDQTTASADANFNAFVPAIPAGSKVYDISSAGSGWLIGGNFNDYTTGRKNIAMLDSTTGTYVGNVMAASDIVRVAQPTYIGGDFISMGGSVRTSLAAIDLTTMTLSSFNPKLIYEVNRRGSVQSVDVSTGSLSAGRLFIVGNFTSINDTNRPATNTIAELDSSGNLVAGFVPTISADGSVLAHKFFNDTMYVYGNFQSIEGQTGGGLARYNVPAIGTPPSIDSSFLPDVDGGSTVYSVYALAGGQVLAGGNIMTVNGGTPASDLIRFNNDGSIDNTMTVPTSLAPPASVGTMVNVIAPSLNAGFTWLGGLFTQGGMQNLMQFETNNTNSINPFDFMTGAVYDVLHDGNSLYIAGAMTSIGGSFLPAPTAITGLVAVNLSNSTAHFKPTLSYTPTPAILAVNRIEKYATGQFFVGGVFDTVNAKSTGNILLLDTSGEPITGFPW